MDTSCHLPLPFSENMVQYKEVEQLYVLSHREFAQYLGDRLIKSSYNERKGNATLSTVRQKLRPYFLEHIPTAGMDLILSDKRTPNSFA